jgi:RimJ/RimL family protein N-acetyltransferase
MPGKVYIETPRLILRDWTDSDTEPYIALNADREVMEFFPSPKNAAETIEQIARLQTGITERDYGFFAVERRDNGGFIGFTGLTQPGFDAWFTPCVEVGWRLSRQNWGYGYASEAAAACLQFGFETLGLSEIYSFTSIHNVRSEKVMQRIGMTQHGYFDHPSIENGHFLRKHVLYRIENRRN